MADRNDQPKTGNDAEATSGDTRPQKGGEGGTTRFGMEDGDDADVPATGLDPDGQGGGQ